MPVYKSDNGTWNVLISLSAPSVIRSSCADPCCRQYSRQDNKEPDRCMRKTKKHAAVWFFYPDFSPVT